jgi:hypothetical protein
MRPAASRGLTRSSGGATVRVWLPDRVNQSFTECLLAQERRKRHCAESIGTSQQHISPCLDHIYEATAMHGGSRLAVLASSSIDENKLFRVE